MMMYLSLFALWTTVAAANADGSPLGSYYSNFSSSDGWEMSTSCGHCKNHGGDECTAYTPDAITWGSAGAKVTTNLTSSKTHCGGNEYSGHLTWTKPIEYGTYTIKAKYFPEGGANNAIAYIGLMGDDSSSCTFILHGCADSDMKCRSTHNSACYASKHNRNKESDIPFDGDLREVNEFQLQFHKEDVTWRINGKDVRHVTGSVLPHAPMTLRLHTRSQWVSKMKEDFSATFYEFKFVPQSSYTSSSVVV